MPADKDDPIADTGMFRAFVAQGDAERADRNPPSGPALILALVGLLILAVGLGLLFLL